MNKNNSVKFNIFNFRVIVLEIITEKKSIRAVLIAYVIVFLLLEYYVNENILLRQIDNVYFYVVVDLEAIERRYCAWELIDSSIHDSYSASEVTNWTLVCR